MLIENDDNSTRLQNSYPSGIYAGIPMIFLLAAGVQPVLAAGTPASEGDPLRQIQSLPQGGFGSATDPAKPYGKAVVDTATRTVQWYNWPNWPNCFNGGWRNC